jgi:transcriptional regulator with XRE-family HTH domain
VPKIRERLATMGRRPVWLSQQTGIDLAAISRIMAGKPVMLETALNIAAALGVPVETLWITTEVESEV